MRCPLAIAITIACSSSCIATQVAHRSLEDAIDKSRLAVVVEIVEVKYEESPMWRVLALKATPIRTIFGEPVSGTAMTCKYSEGRPHLRGTTTVSPLVWGSGIEFSTKPKDRVILLIATGALGTSECEALRIEGLQSEALITNRKSRTSPP